MRSNLSLLLILRNMTSFLDIERVFPIIDKNKVYCTCIPDSLNSRTWLWLPWGLGGGGGTWDFPSQN